MTDIQPKLAILKNHLESAAFLVSKGKAEKEAHSKIIQGLVVISEIESSLEKPRVSQPSTKTDATEVRKVSRRLKLWAKRQNQINSKILNAYLKLERSGISPVTEADLRNKLPEETSFESNLTQMKIIAEKNHGKVFEQYGDNITLWEPVIPDIREYEKIVFENKKNN
jgi:hypothetical protein